MDTKTNPKLVFSVYLFGLFLKYSLVSLAGGADTISANQFLSGNDTIVSAGGMFELGFFRADQLSSKYYIGMWYYEQIVSEQTIVWVANREQPVSDSFSSVLKISDGNLVLFDESKYPVWSTNVTSTSTSGSIEALLLDNGNLVLLRAGSSTTSEPLWQSFHHPTDTLLPGGRIGINSLTKQTQILTSWKTSVDPAPGLFSLELEPSTRNAYVIRWNRSIAYWTSGPWDAKSRIFSFVPELKQNYVYNFSYVANENETYFTYSLYDPKTVSRLVMNTSGQIKQLIVVQSFRLWTSFWSQPMKQCEVYDLCGAFGSCSEINLPACNCLTGFEPKSRREWDLQAYTSGCSRKTSLHCGNGTSANGTPDRFLEFPSMSLPENKESVEIGSKGGCESICLNDCSCTAYAYDSSSGCSIWTRELLDLQQLTASDNEGRSLYLRLAASELMYLKSTKE